LCSKVMDGLSRRAGPPDRNGEADVAAARRRGQVKDPAAPHHSQARVGPCSWAVPARRLWPDKPGACEVWRSGSWSRSPAVSLSHRPRRSGAAAVRDVDRRCCRGRRTSRCRRPPCWPPAGRRARGEELAIAAGSHSGEDGHRELVAGMLAAAGCARRPRLPAGAARRTSRPATRGWPPAGSPERLAMNCSGKHAAMLSPASPPAGRPTATSTGAPAAAGDRGAARARPRARRWPPSSSTAAAPHSTGCRSTGLARGVASLVERPPARRAVGRRRHAGAPLVRRRAPAGRTPT
jgi:hypothetical protein